MNILLSCAGRRNYIVKYFKEALAGRGIVIAVDSSEYAPALYEADKAFVVPQVNRADYIEALLDICIKNDVGMIVPLNDLELPVLAERRDVFINAGIVPVISTPQVIDICFDKWKTYLFIRNMELSTPATYINLDDFYNDLQVGMIEFPVVVKPRWGAASLGIEYPEDTNDLEAAYRLLKKKLFKSFLSDASANDPERAIIIQEHLDGSEYGLDVVNDLKGNYIVTFAKKKLAMRAGETDRAITTGEDELINLGRSIGEHLSHIGNLDCDVIRNSKGLFVLEMNPRFGGGYPFSHESGANIPAALISWASGNCIDPDWIRIEHNRFSAKCDRIVTF